MNRLMKLVAISLVLPLSGCATYFAMWNNDPATPPTTPPRIILGQTATYWGKYSGLDKEIIDAWRKTGLFKEVLPVNSKEPPTQGTFIKTKCESTIVEQDGTFILGLMGLLTLWTLPSNLDFDKVSCTTEFYQNGALLTTSYSGFTYKRMWSSWVGALMYSNDKVIHEGHVAAAPHIVTKDLVALKKAYP